MKYKVLIVEDEKVDRELILLLIKSKPELEVMKITNNSIELEQLLIKYQFDLIFLDVQIQGASSIETIEKLMKKKQITNSPYIIFTTSLEKHALKAFELGAVDFLLKPYNIVRFDKAVDRFLLQVDKKESNEFIIKKRNKVISIDIRNIEYLSSNGRNIIIHTGKEEYSFIKSLKEIESKLRLKDFIRIHKSFIVNRDIIHSLNKKSNNIYRLQLSNTSKTILPVGRKYLSQIKKYLNYSEK